MNFLTLDCYTKYRRDWLNDSCCDFMVAWVMLLWFLYRTISQWGWQPYSFYYLLFLTRHCMDAYGMKHTEVLDKMVSEQILALRKCWQLTTGERQVGKTTVYCVYYVLRTFLESLKGSTIFLSNMTLHAADWQLKT